MTVLCKKSFDRKLEFTSLLAYYVSLLIRNFASPIVGHLYKVKTIECIGAKTFYILEGFNDNTWFATDNFEIVDEDIKDFKIKKTQRTSIGELFLN